VKLVICSGNEPSSDCCQILDAPSRFDTNSMRCRPDSSELPDCKDTVAQSLKDPAVDNRYHSDLPFVCFVDAVDASKLCPSGETTGFMHKPSALSVLARPIQRNFPKCVAVNAQVYTTPCHPLKCWENFHHHRESIASCSLRIVHAPDVMGATFQ
jgi:hypothetical protein